MGEYTDRAAGIVQGLRELADFLERHPDCSPYNIRAALYLTGDDVKPILRQLGGCEKDYADQVARFTKVFGPTVKYDWDHYVSLTLMASRENVCTARVVGKQTVERKDYSAIPTVTVEEDIIEWDCHPILADD